MWGNLNCGSNISTTFRIFFSLSSTHHRVYFFVNSVKRTALPFSSSNKLESIHFRHFAPSPLSFSLSLSLFVDAKPVERVWVVRAAKSLVLISVYFFVFDNVFVFLSHFLYLSHLVFGLCFCLGLNLHVHCVLIFVRSVCITAWRPHIYPKTHLIDYTFNI